MARTGNIYEVILLDDGHRFKLCNVGVYSCSGANSLGRSIIIGSILKIVVRKGYAITLF